MITLEGGDGSLEAVNETHVVVTRDIGHHLGRLQRPRCLGIVDLGHIDLRMTDSTHNAKLQTLLAIGSATQPTGLGIVRERTAQGIANLVGESSNTGHLRNIGLDA